MMHLKQYFLLSLAVLLAQSGMAQHHYTHDDTLRGSITPERAWWDLLHYELSVNVDVEAQSIYGSNDIRYKVLSESQVMQIDLQKPLTISAIYQDGEPVTFNTDGNAHFVTLNKKQSIGDVNTIQVEYAGIPKKAVRAPWDGGFSWDKDEKGNHFIATSCQGLGASVWWPCKDHMYDEPDNGIVIHATVPADLTVVANGRLVDTSKKGDSRTFSWQVVNPINNYGVNLNIGDYAHFTEKYDGENGKLDMDYWVLSYNLEKAKMHFKDAPKMMKAFEHWFGPYPFYEDGYKLVEVPYWGMEHQSSVTYGNEYKMGMKGQDHTGTGWGLKFDFIIIHESGHEWFANNITNVDVADMWLHESFTCYSEAIFLEYYYGKEAAADYIKGSRGLIANLNPIISDYGVNTSSATSDMYYKGANILHTLRQWVDNDEKWLGLMRGLNSAFYHQTVTSAQVEAYMASYLALELGGFFDQYLRDSRVPVFEYRIIPGKGIVYKWTNCSEDFRMPLKVFINGEPTQLQFQSTEGDLNFLQTDTEISRFTIDSNYYVFEINVMGR